MFVVITTDARGDRSYLAGDDTFHRSIRYAARYDAATALRICEDNSTAQLRLTFADYAGEEARYTLQLRAAAEAAVVADRLMFG